MKAFWNRALAALYFYLCFAPVPMMVGQWLLKNFAPALLAAAVMLPLSFLIVLIPNHVGGKVKRSEVLQSHRLGGDPDPDRNLRSETQMMQKRSIRFPLRIAALIAAAVAVALVTVLAPIPGLAGVFFLYRIILGAVLGVMLLMSEYSIATGEACNRRSILTGLVVYMAVGFLANYVMKDARLTRYLGYLGAVFLLVTGFLLNERAISAGAMASQSYKPPRSLRWRNRVILAVFAVVVLIVSQFDRIRAFFSNALKAGARGIIYAIDWINNKLFWDVQYSIRKVEPDGELEQAPIMGTTQGWDAGEYIAAIVAAIIALIILVFLGIKLWRFTKKFRKRVKEWMKNFAKGVGEEYEDVRESLLDSKEEEQSTRTSLKARIAKLLKRDPKWDTLSPKEKIRFLLMLIYRKNAAAVPNFYPLTAREALAVMKNNFKDPDSFADLYDEARYSGHDITDRQAEDARKEAKL